MFCWRAVFAGAALGLAVSVASGRELRVPDCQFARLLHGISRTHTTTTLRKEVKVVVPVDTATRFLARVNSLLGEKAPAGAKPRVMSLRDQPDNGREKFVTDTDYFPVIRGIGPDGHRVFSGVIRIRNYRIVPLRTRVSDLDRRDAPIFPLVRLADGEDEFARLEFKVGHPGMDPVGLFRDVDGVVDKPGVVMSRSDIDLLFASPESYRKNAGKVIDRAIALRKTDRSGNAQPVNNPDEVRGIVARVGKLERSPIGQGIRRPALNIRYVRTARKIVFPSPLAGPKGPPSFEAQITVDQDIRMKDYLTGAKAAFRPGDRVIELKIPTEYADLSDAELNQLGLGDLAAIRRAYQALEPAPGTRRNSGKRAQLTRIAARALRIGS